MNTYQKHSFLYSENESFLQGDTPNPFNELEILDNLYERYGVSKLPIHKRLSLGILLALITLSLAGGNWLMLNSIILMWQGWESLPTSIFPLILVLVGGGLSVYISGQASYKLLFLNQSIIEKSWKELLTEGKFLEGSIIKSELVPPLSVRITYLVDNEERITGNYIVSNALGVVRILGIKSQKITVWYVDKKLSTLL